MEETIVMMRSVILAGVVAACAAPASALEVIRSTEIAAPPAAVWKTIGMFCGIGDWHPVVEKCASSTKDGKPVRTLGLKGGGTIVEEQLARDETKMDYTYTILESPLPVSDYTSTIRVVPQGKGSKVTWMGTFKAKGAPEAKAEAAIAGVYEGGLKGIADKTR